MRASTVKTIEPSFFRIKLGSGFILLFALIFFFDDSGFLAALLPAVLIHELGHVLFMLFFGARPTQLKATLSGFEIDYSGLIGEKQEMVTALAGPVFGLMFSFLCSRLGQFWGSNYLLLCAGLGFVLNLFNFLPSMPLDGGRVLGFALRALFGADRARPLIRSISLITASLIVLFGLYFTARGVGFALFLAGIWLFVLQMNKSCK